MIETVYIDRMSYGPDAVGRLANGKTVFVRGGTPGESCDVEIVEDRERYAKGVALDFLPSAQNATAPWAYLPYSVQLDAKHTCVRDALLRVGHVSEEEVEAVLRPIVACKAEWGYRNKLELAATMDSRNNFALGFHDASYGGVGGGAKRANGADGVAQRAAANNQSSDDHAEAVDSCRLGNRLVEHSPKALSGALRYLQGRDGDLGIYRVGIRGSIATNSVEVALWTPPGPFPRGFAAKMLRDAVGATSVVRVIADKGKARRVKQLEVLDGDGHWRENIMLAQEDPVTFQVSAPSFFQVNTRQAARLVRLALDALDVCSGEHVCDLYSGVGAFSIPLARAGANVTAIELEGSAARDLRQNCKRNNVDINVVCDDVARAFPKLAKSRGLSAHDGSSTHNSSSAHGKSSHRKSLDALLVDPPRAGLDKRVISQIVDASPSRMVYVSCDPQTLARDVARLREKGYKLTSATPVDMFPQTYHVETVSTFERA